MSHVAGMPHLALGVLPALPLAHSGHWYHSLVYAVPVLIIVALLVYGTWRDRRRRSREGGSGEGR